MSPQTCILLVDDEAAIIENLAPFLERSGFEVTTASNGEDALTRSKPNCRNWLSVMC